MPEQSEAPTTYRQKLKKTRQERRKKATSYISQNCVSGTVRESNALLAMITCSKKCTVRGLRFLVPDIGEDWTYKVLKSEGQAFSTLDGPKDIKPGFTELEDCKLEPHHVLVIRAFYSGDAFENFEYSLDYEIQVK